MSTKHTPGPWKFENDGRGVCTVTSATPIEDSGEIIGYEPVASGITWPPDARLIAAAPEMLDEHERVVGSVAVLLMALDEGRSSEPEFRETLEQILAGARAALAQAVGQ
jgi:hypothetical protein